ncbi:MAG: hypothetical protein H6Q13_2195 [Bacteroidetes bacterium]|nr:hypothetical protein [Bacteroidota bacterium]
MVDKRFCITNKDQMQESNELELGTVIPVWGIVKKFKSVM